MTTMLEKAPSGKTMLHVACPGWQMKFHVLYDEPSKRYRLLSTQATDSMIRPDRMPADRYNLPNNERRRLQLHFSKNMIDWCFAGLVAVGPARTLPVNSTLGIQRLLEALENDTRLEFTQAPLSDVAAFLKDQHGIVIQLDSPPLRAAGVGADTPVTQRIKGINLHSGLRLTLGELGLSYVLRDDALVITTQHEAQRLMQQGFINAEEVEHEFRKGVNSRRQGTKTVDALLKDAQFRFAATPLVDVVSQLNRQHAIAIGIDQQSLASARIRPDVPCTLDVEGVPLASALRTLLDGVGLTYVVDGEFIRITAARKVAPGR